MDIERAAKSPREMDKAISNLVRQLFITLRTLVGEREIADPAQLGIALGTIFDICISLLYAQKVVATDWLYCPPQQHRPAMLFYTYIKSCPRCGKVQTEVPKHKPPSDTIGRYASLVVATILEELCIQTQNGWSVRVPTISRNDVDIIMFSSTHLVLCEIKASPLIAFAPCRTLNKPLTGDTDNGPIVIETHRKTDCPDFRERGIYLYLPVEDVQIAVGKGSIIHNFIKNHAKDMDLIMKFVNVWGKIFEGYQQRWKGANGSTGDGLRWLTFGCGDGVDDSKNAPGLDRTDDIKKALYQTLKLGERFRNQCKSNAIRIGLISNLHPARHYTDYLKGFEDALWTHEHKLHDLDNSVWRYVQKQDLTPFYDVLLTFTCSWFRDSIIEQAFNLKRLFEAMGGKHG